MVIFIHLMFVATHVAINVICLKVFHHAKRQD